MATTVCVLSLCKIVAVINCYLKLCFIGGNLSFVSFVSCASSAHLLMLASILFPSLVECFRILKGHLSSVGVLLTHWSAWFAFVNLFCVPIDYSSRKEICNGFWK